MRILYLPHEYSQQRQKEKRRWIYPVHLAMEAEYYRKQGREVCWGGTSRVADKVVTEVEGIPFLSLPHPDRVFTGAFDKRYQKNGNFKYRPGTYIQSASGCWWGQCEFCVEKKNQWQVRSVEDVIVELEECKRLGFREAFDDSGTFPIGSWLEKFCGEMLHGPSITLGCNMRMVDVDYRMMKAAGFRMLLFGLESANQQTLDRINKGTKVEDYKYIVKAAEAGLDCHIAVMFGYPWETYEDAERTLRLVHYLLRNGYAKTAQASFYQPPDGKNNPSQKKYVRRIYEVAKYPDFWLNKLGSLRSLDDFKYLYRQIREGLMNK